MRPFPFGQFLLALCGIAALAAGITELLAWAWSCELRVPLYGGLAAGLVVGAAGLPFAVKLAKVEARAQAAFWKWWGCGVLVRLLLLASLACGLVKLFASHLLASVLMLMGVYLAGMFLEAFWLARIFIQTDPVQPAKMTKS